MIPSRIQAERRVYRGPVARPVGEPDRKLGDRIRLVETEYLARRIRTVAKAVPDLALRVLVPAEQRLLGIARLASRDKNDHCFGLGKPRQIRKMAVGPIGVVRVRVADRLRRGGDSRYAAVGLLAHSGNEPRAALTVLLVGVLHRGKFELERT
jgi:hypothetical protein